MKKITPRSILANFDIYIMPSDKKGKKYKIVDGCEFVYADTHKEALEELFLSTNPDDYTLIVQKDKKGYFAKPVSGNDADHPRFLSKNDAIGYEAMNLDSHYYFNQQGEKAMFYRDIDGQYQKITKMQRRKFKDM